MGTDFKDHDLVEDLETVITQVLGRWQEAPKEEQPQYLHVQVKLAVALSGAITLLKKQNKIWHARTFGKFWTNGMKRQREEADAVCNDPDCILSAGEGHCGPCEPCECGLDHAIEECPADKVHAPYPHGRRLGGIAQCGWEATCVRMTFRGSKGEILRGVNCEGCLAMERYWNEVERQKEIVPAAECGFHE